MGKKYHLCQSVRGALNHSTRDFKRIYTNCCKREGESRYMTPDEVREYFYDCLSEGKEVIPLCDCDNFDFKKGCQGHEEI